ncbi:MAG: hypothetical protein QGD96_09005 [Anaerolineae bacterium]|nr:hypothetical protein [Anaerolineae bacterium]
MNLLRKNRIFISLAILAFAPVACRPIFAIGWTELIILLVLILFLLGPVLLRIYRTLEKFRKINASKENEDDLMK